MSPARLRLPPGGDVAPPARCPKGGAQHACDHHLDLLAAEAVHAAMQRALTPIEDRASGRPLDLDTCADLDELTRVTMALVVIGDSLVRSFNRPPSEVIDRASPI